MLFGNRVTQPTKPTQLQKPLLVSGTLREMMVLVLIVHQLLFVGGDKMIALVVSRSLEIKFSFACMLILDFGRELEITFWVFSLPFQFKAYFCSLKMVKREGA